ncbi:DUF1819 family protein [uncultured Ruminococcus sp.]|uniref:DUF1819 family protein n=1 Tax=uncultured Ruminococcus sp. TaxID=165186 RepID=UPI0025DBC289|nr:DUF1819 family protein [uncultured Ruminococcus sp.]
MGILKHYSGGLTREQFLFYEIRLVASLICENNSRDEIYNRIMQENLFQYPTERMIRSMTNICFKRIDSLASQMLMEHLANASTAVAKQINLYAIMRENGIVYDFMTDVIGEKMRTQQMDFSHKDINSFFDTLQEYYPAAADWSESTRAKLRQVLTRFLVECEYLDNVRSQALKPVFLFPELEEGIRQLSDETALCAFNCFC